jgi:mannosylglycerate hydrolase
MKKLYAYVHTHWDREWYHPFETFRTHLVSVLKNIVDDLETGKLKRFYLDGQSVILEDALASAPELAPRISKLMEAGELAAGPWYVLPDEMLVCGESLIRNLKFGIASIKNFGSAELVGYAPDTFGHSQDLPRILRGFSINSAFVWRGVPRLSFGPCFWWQSPDNSKVLAYHLSRGYYQTAVLETAADSNGAFDKLASELSDFAEDRSQWDNSSLYDKTPDAFLYPIGADHTAPPRDLDQRLEQLNQRLNLKGWNLTPVHLGEFAELLQNQADAANKLVGMVARELRDNAASKQHANAFLLPGVLSTRLYLKRENREAERRLFRVLEPLFSVLSLRRLAEYPHGELQRALKLLLQNHPHDSICGCSVDAVHDEMLTRYARINQIVDALLDYARRELSGISLNSAKSSEDPNSGMNRLRIINSAARPFTGVVPFKWYSITGKLEEHSNEFVQTDSSAPEEHLFSGWGLVPYYENVESKQGWVWVENLPSFGELNYNWPLKRESTNKTPLVKLRGKSIENGILRVFVNDRSQLCVDWTTPDGSHRQYELQHKIIDSADGGDTYNYDPLLNDNPIYAKLTGVQAGRKGPLLASLILKYEIKIPASLVEDPATTKTGIPSLKRSTQKIEHEIETELILKRGSRILEFETRWLNQSSGHRLEVQLSTGNPVHASFSENHFSLVRRYHQTRHQKTKLPVERGEEAPCDRYPAQRFLVANGQVILNKGLPEYGVDGDAVSLTVLRSVPILSRGRINTRGGGAGPHLPTAGAECKGWNRVSYAWAPMTVFQKRRILSDVLDEAAISEAYDIAAEYEQEPLLALSCVENSDTADLIKSSSDCVKVLNAYMNQNRDAVFVRVQNLGVETLGTRLFLNFDFQSAHLCRLDEETSEEAFLYRDYLPADAEQGSQREICALEINFGPNELKTIKFLLPKDGGENPAGAVAAKAPAPRRKRSSRKTG